MTEFRCDIARHIWETKYRFRDGDDVHEHDIEDSWRRIAEAIAEPEGDAADEWRERFLNLLQDFRFLPGGRIQAGAGTGRRVTLFNCFVMGVIEDDMERIFDHLKEAALTMQQGGGIGYDFSTLRPAGTAAHATGTVASGPISFMRIWDTMCDIILSSGARRGAMMATMRCDHPDIEHFVAAKADARELRRFNVSVQVTDDFMRAVDDDGDWPLVFPADELEQTEGDLLERHWPGRDGAIPCRVVRTVRARELWHRIMRATYDYAEPGVLFVDRVNAENNLWYREHITATNPCGEIPLPPYGACDLGSINLTRFVRRPFQADADIDYRGLADIAATATRFLDNVIDVSRFPLSQQAERARSTRRIGLGITGLGDALAMLGLHYGTREARAVAEEILRSICHSAYRSSVQLAREKGTFPDYDQEHFLQGPFIRSLPASIRADIARYGLRNSHLMALAPTGTISLLAGNVSSGVEPIYDFAADREVLEADGTRRRYRVTDYAVAEWRRLHGNEPLPAAFVGALSLPPEEHLAMEAALQPYVDNSISKTINVPEDYPFEQFESLYRCAWELGLKGCTTYRFNRVTGAILTPGRETAAREDGGPHCCGIEREAD